MGSVPEPPDGSRIEFVYHTDPYAAWRDDQSSVRAGWSATEGWCLFGQTVPVSWATLCEMFADDPDALANLVVWVPGPREVPTATEQDDGGWLSGGCAPV